MDPSTKDQIIEKALLSRRVEELLLELFSKGKLAGTVHTCIGQEFVGAVLSMFFEAGDVMYSNHRCHGHFLSLFGDVEGLVGEVMGRANGVCGGRGGSQHLCKDGFYSNGIQGGIVPISAGLAFARKLRKDGKIAFVFIGDGTLGEGVVYETLNLVSKWEIPLLVVVENNGYAQSTSSRETLAGDILARAAAFGIRTASGSTWEWEKLYAEAASITQYVRVNQQPAFLVVDTYRLKAHSKGDDNRAREEVAAFEAKDPLNLFLAGGSLRTLDQNIGERIRRAVMRCEEAAHPQSCAPALGTVLSEIAWEPIEKYSGRYVSLLNQAFKDLMSEKQEILFLGEDVMSPYGGAFKVSAGLSDQFPGRVLNTPISEAAIVGLGAGLAIAGHRPVVEIMFGDFTGLAFDQLLNHSSKFEFMYNDQVKVPLVVRTPMGGKRGYGPTHSQSIEKHFLGIPGLRVVAINEFIHPAKIYRQILSEERAPTLVIENKILYTKFFPESEPLGFTLLESSERYPVVWLKPEAPQIDLTIISYGESAGVVAEVLDSLFTDHDMVAQLLCPTQLYPFDIGPYLSIVERSRAVLLIEEGQSFGSFASEVCAQLSEYGCRLPVHRLASQEMPIGASKVLEDCCLPGKAHIVEAARSLLEVIDG